MKSILVAIASIAVSALVSAAPSYAEPESYQLNCRASSAMTATVRGNGSVVLKFTASEGGGTPQRGECTWVDRPLNEEEPTRIKASGDLARSLIDGLLTGGRFSIDVYNDGAGYMVMTGE